MSDATTNRIYQVKIISQVGLSQKQLNFQRNQEAIRGQQTSINLIQHCPQVKPFIRYNPLLSVVTKCGKDNIITDLIIKVL